MPSTHATAERPRQHNYRYLTVDQLRKPIDSRIHLPCPFFSFYNHISDKADKPRSEQPAISPLKQLHRSISNINRPFRLTKKQPKAHISSNQQLQAASKILQQEQFMHVLQDMVKREHVSVSLPSRYFNFHKKRHLIIHKQANINSQDQRDLSKTLFRQNLEGHQGVFLARMLAKKKQTILQGIQRKYQNIKVKEQQPSLYRNTLQTIQHSSSDLQKQTQKHRELTIEKKHRYIKLNKTKKEVLNFANSRSFAGMRDGRSLEIRAYNNASILEKRFKAYSRRMRLQLERQKQKREERRLVFEQKEAEQAEMMGPWVTAEYGSIM